MPSHVPKSPNRPNCHFPLRHAAHTNTPNTSYTIISNERAQPLSTLMESIRVSLSYRILKSVAFYTHNFLRRGPWCMVLPADAAGNTAWFRATDYPKYWMHYLANAASAFGLYLFAHPEPTRQQTGGQLDSIAFGSTVNAAAVALIIHTIYTICIAARFSAVLFAKGLRLGFTCMCVCLAEYTHWSRCAEPDVIGLCTPHALAFSLCLSLTNHFFAFRGNATRSSTSRSLR